MQLPRDRVYAHLCDTASARLPVGTNAGIGAALGLAGGTVHHLMSLLSAKGMIAVEYTANGKQRRVVIRDTGARTEWSAPHAVSPTARQRGPKLGTRAPGWGFQIMSDASLYGQYAAAVREVRRQGHEVVKAATPGWFKVAGTDVPPEKLVALAERRERL